MKRLNFKQKLFLFLIILSVCFIAVDSYYLYSVQKRDLLAGIDKKLEAVASSTSLIIPPEYVSTIKDMNAVSQEEYQKVQNELREIAKITQTKFIYIIMKMNNEIVFVSDSDEEGKGLEIYKSAPKSLKETFETGTPYFDLYMDEFGTFRSAFVPFKTTNGTSYVIGADVPFDMIEEKIKQLLFREFVIAVIVLISLLILQYIILNRTLKPLAELTTTTRELMDKDFNLDEKIINQIEGISSAKRDEVGELAGALLLMYSTLQKYIVVLQETTAAEERMKKELSIAYDIQMGILPRKFPAFPECQEFDLHAVIEPARVVGGDLYDYFLLDRDRLFFLIGDVSDKGIPAALFMTVTNTLFKTYAMQNTLSINEIMNRVNIQLCKNNPSFMFVTVFAGILNLSTGVIEYSDGGHEPPFILRKGHVVEKLKKKGGMALCMMEDYQYESDIIQLQPGDALVLYTDGVTEAMNVEHKLFSADRISNSLQKVCDNASPFEINERLNQEVKSFVGEEP